MTLRLRFWLWAMDRTQRGPRWLCLWCLARASDETYRAYVEVRDGGADCGEGEAF